MANVYGSDAPGPSPNGPLKGPQKKENNQTFQGLLDTGRINTEKQRLETSLFWNQDHTWYPGSGQVTVGPLCP